MILFMDRFSLLLTLKNQNLLIAQTVLLIIFMNYNDQYLGQYHNYAVFGRVLTVEANNFKKLSFNSLSKR
jgi:hypothetical protein